MRKRDTHPDPQKREEPDLAPQLSEEPAPIDVKSFGRKLAEIIAEALKVKRGRRGK